MAQNGLIRHGSAEPEDVNEAEIARWARLRHGSVNLHVEALEACKEILRSCRPGSSTHNAAKLSCPAALTENLKFGEACVHFRLEVLKDFIL